MTDAADLTMPTPGLLFQLATLPALLVGRWRERLRASVRADLLTFGNGTGKIMFAVLTVVAVGYPIVASIAHATFLFTGIRGGAQFDAAIYPLFDMVYSESLPFMAAAAVIGLFSPALGVLFMTVFIPTDLLAANGSPELMQFGSQVPFSAIAARLTSYIMLWLLAVEIPLAARSFGDWLVRETTGSASVVRVVAGRVATAGFLVFIWARAIPWVIAPIFTWSALQGMQSVATNPTWQYWPILVGAGVVAAGLAAFWPNFPARRPALVYFTEPAVSAPPLFAVLARQLVLVAVLALLAPGLANTVAEGAVLVVGLLVAGPGITLLGPRIPIPAALSRASDATRWSVALIASALLALILLIIGDGALYTSTYTGLMIVLVVAIIAFRVLLVAGRRSDQQAGPKAPVMVSAVLGAVAGLILSLAIPAIVFANDCSDLSLGEIATCPGIIPSFVLLPPIMAAIFAAGFILKAAGAGPPKPPPPKQPPVYQGGRYIFGSGSGQPGPWAKPPPKAPPEPSWWERWNNFWNGLFMR